MYAYSTHLLWVFGNTLESCTQSTFYNDNLVPIPLILSPAWLRRHSLVLLGRPPPQSGFVTVKGDRLTASYIVDGLVVLPLLPVV